MALYREGKAAMAADGTVTGTGTKWQSSLSLIRPGATIMFLSSPIQMAVVNKVVSDTEIKAITTKGAVVASSDYAILLSDSLTVDGLAQDVAETLRYYQSQETVIADAIEFFKTFDFESLQTLANQVRADSEAADASATAAAASESAAKTSETNAKASEMAAETAIDQVQQIINNAGEQSTLVVLAQTNGFKSIGQVESFNALRSVVPSYAGQRILLASHYEGWNALAHAPFGGGEFVARSGAAIDDGGYTCVPTGQTAFYWQRIPKNPGKVCATEFGLYDGAELNGILEKAINYCIKNSLNHLSMPSLGPAGYTLAGGLEFVNSGNMLIIEGPGMATKGVSPVITHTGANIGLTFKRESQAQSLFNPVILRDFTVTGNALATAFVRFSDFYGGSVFDAMIRDYTIGTAIDVYNDKGWTEVVRVDNVIVRTSKRGIWFHSNPASTDWQTVSFYGAKISNFAFQHGIAGASEGIYVGDGSREDNLYNCDIDMMGWWEGGGDSTAIYVADKARIDGSANFRYDGFAASAITSGTQPCRLVKKAGTTGYVKLNCKNYKHEASLGLTAGVTQLTVRPWLAIAEIIAGVATPHPTLPGESIVNVPGMKCKLIGKLFKGQKSVISVAGLPPFHRYKVTTRCNLSSTAQQQYIVNIPNDNNGGITTRTDSVPDVTTNTDTIINGTTAESTSKSTAKNKNFGPIYISNAGGLVDNTYSVTSKQGFQINLDGTHSNVVNDEYPVSIEIEAID
ncbi:putative tail fiber protein [Klebsiella phage vB_KpnS_PMM-G3]|nr:putative tail fiber protein [Klebsiella phage vB_KpnS_PMM-G3]